ncbi:MAG: response regulator [Synechococcales bacterium]|nr:response regulator [Synechococcales bacterium]
MSTEITVMSRLLLTLMTLQQQRATGELLIFLDRQQSSHWQIYLYLGRLVYATGGTHPVRRWYRAVKQHCPQLLQEDWQEKFQPVSELWEAEVLNQAVTQNQITAAQARVVIQNIVKEVFFAFVEHQTLETQWNPGKQPLGQGAFLSLEQVINAAKHLREQWRNEGLGPLQELLSQFSPDMAPVIRSLDLLQNRVKPGTYNVLCQLMQGKLTLWDVSVRMHKPMPNIMRSLLPLIRQGAIGLKDIEDELPPFQPSMNSGTAPIQIEGSPIVACIDDSPMVVEVLRNILEPAGCEVVGINDPLHGIATLLECRPHVIFLDLMMPTTNGYELCNFLRKTSIFHSTPIVILTSRDKMVDRMQAKKVGASEFLTKPPVPEQVLQMVDRFVNTPKFSLQTLPN